MFGSFVKQELRQHSEKSALPVNYWCFGACLQ